MNSVRQLALAVINHEAATARFPTANSAPLSENDLSNLGRVAPGAHPDRLYVVDGMPNRNNDGYSWIVKILPYMEENMAYDRIARASEQFTVTAFQPSIASDPRDPASHPSSMQLPFLICPSFAGEMTAQDPNNYGLPANGAEAVEVAGGNYVAMAAATRGIKKKGVVDDHAPELGGVIISKPLRVREVRDGTSNTLLLCESRHEKFSSWYSGQSAWVIGFHPDETPKIVETNQGKAISDDDRRANTPSLNSGRDINPPPGEDAGSRWYATELAGGNRDGGPSSTHGGGIINHAFTDGHA